MFQYCCPSPVFNEDSECDHKGVNNCEYDNLFLQYILYVLFFDPTWALQLWENQSSFKLVADHLQVGFYTADETWALRTQRLIRTNWPVSAQNFSVCACHLYNRHLNNNTYVIVVLY